jgi:hypothetical protein
MPLATATRLVKIIAVGDTFSATPHADQVASRLQAPIGSVYRESTLTSNYMGVPPSLTAIVCLLVVAHTETAPAEQLTAWLSQLEPCRYTL